MKNELFIVEVQAIIIEETGNKKVLDRLHLLMLL